MQRIYRPFLLAPSALASIPLIVVSLACTPDDTPLTPDETGTSTSGDGDGDPTTGDGDGDPATGDGDGDPATGDGDGDPVTGDGDGDPVTGDGDGDGDVCGDGIVNGDEVCDDGVNDGAYGSCAADCMAFGPNCGDGELNGPEECDDANANSGDGCLGTCLIPTNCQHILDSDDFAENGVYEVDIDSTGELEPFNVTCDMTTDGGGWTRCGNIDETGVGSVCVRESDSYINAADLLNQSFCKLMLDDQSPQALMVHNLTLDDGGDFGFDDKVRITWDDSPPTIYTYDNHPIADCRNLTTNTAWQDCQYATHVGPNWANAAWSFTVGGVDTDYDGNFGGRVTLGLTYGPDAPAHCRWASFGGETNPENLSNNWGNADNVGDIYLR